MDDDVEITLLAHEPESSNPQTDQNPTDAMICDGNDELASIEPCHDEPPEDKEPEEEEEMAEITRTTTVNKLKGSSEMDKFKRRLIRAIARLIRNDQAPTEDMWEELKKQTGCDCKLLWDRMRALTTKKLERLFTAEDTINNITQIAQLTVTDWLMFDLVLVHEKLDVIGQDEVDPDDKESPKILEDLFAIVVIYNLEFLQGDDLTKAWFEATKDYNGTKRKCSPMLLQRRWYQMKAKVREKFYHFWFSYRGDQRQLAAANEFKPTDLEMEIVKHFKYITTKQFATWEELIEQKKVALPEDFERLQLAKRRIFRTETGPDLEVIEPHVETIDLEQDTDSEESRDSALPEPNKNVKVGMVKIESVDEISDDDDVHVLESVHIPLETNVHPEADIDSEDSNAMTVENQISTVINIEEDISVVDDNFATNAPTIDIAEQQDIDAESQDDVEMIMPRIVASTSIANISNDYDKVMPKILNVSSAANVNEEPANEAVNHEINGILESVAENISMKNLFNVMPTLMHTDKTLSATYNMDAKILVKNIIDNEINTIFKETEVKVKSEEDEKKLDFLDAAPNDINIFEGIELEDDGIEYIEEDDDMKEVQRKIENTDDSDCGNMPTIDLKLLLTPLVYTKKLDDMDVFRFIDYNAVKDKRVIENADNESKPVDRNSVKMEEISQERQPIPDSDAFSDSSSEYHSEVDLGPETISSSSWLFTKLKKLSYNPIQLCKNPDFNTRLKRLSAGFFSSERNRSLLKECKPLTIDLHKSFEAKLHNNTLYLSGRTSMKNELDALEENVIGNTVLPTTMPIDNLINNVMNDILGPAQPSDSSSATQFSTHPVILNSHLVERKKVINLPDIAQIRRLNEKLLTAEVTPIQVSNITKPPVNIVPTQPNLQNINIIQNNSADVINKGIDSTISTTFVNDNNSIFSNINLTPNVPSEISQSKVSDASAGNVKTSGDSFNVSHINTAKKTKSLESQNNSYKVSKGSLLNRFNNQQFKNVKEPKKGVRLNHVEVSWNPKPRKFVIPQDVLLTSDTVDKILNICKGETVVLSKNSKSQSKINKALRKQALRQKMKEDSSGNKNKNQSNHEVPEVFNEVVIASEQQPIENVGKDTGDNTIQNQTANETQKNNIERIVKRNMISRKSKYCCWAREKIVKLNCKKRSVKRHDCPRPLCNCCCRQELVEKMVDVRLATDKIAQPEKEKIKHPIKITVSSPQNPYASSTQMPQTPHKNSTEIPPNTSKISSQTSLKVSVGSNTDFDMDFENGFAANLADLNSSSNFFNKDSASSINVTYAPNINQANGQTQTLVNLMVLDKNTSTKNNDIIFDNSNSSNVSPIEYSMFSDKNHSTFPLKEGNLTTVISKKNVERIVLDKNNSTCKFLSLKQTNSSNTIPKKITLVSNKNNPVVSINQFKSDNENPNKIAVVSNKKNPIFSISENYSHNVLEKKNKVSDKKNPTYPYNPKTVLKNPISLKSGHARLSCDTSSIALQERGEKSDQGKVLFLTNDRIKNAYSRTPICLGKNKILLCTFEKSHLKKQAKLDDVSYNTNNNDSIQNTTPQVTLPDGVRIVLLPNKELALSIDPGIELDSNQLSYLPTLMASIQQQLAEADITKSQLDPLEKNDGSTDSNNVTINICNESEIQLGDNKKDNSENLNAITLSCREQLKDHSDENTEVDTNKSKEAGKLGNSNASVVDLKDNSDLNKKTILSDLMEMSGISAEDTHIINNGSPTKQKSELYPTSILEGLQSQITNNHNAKFINNPLFKNPAVQTALSRCPELCVVFSYQELRYASENNAQFFKMDIETGVVVSINLVIKKQMSQRNSDKSYALSKSVIDLTDDPDEDETINIEEKNAGTFEIEPPARKQDDRAVPVKLFSSIHPSILRRGKSLLVHSVTTNSKPQAIIKTKKLIRVIQVKQKRKQALDCVESIDLDSDVEQKEDVLMCGNSNVTKSDDDSDSDDEPLAFKAKRMKESFEPKEPIEPLNQITEKVVDQGYILDDDHQNTELVPDNLSEVTEIVAENPKIDDTPKNIADEIQAGVNSTPESEPVEFEQFNFDGNVPESSDDDCILGV